MSFLNPRAIALQGIGFGSNQTALQGFALVQVAPPGGGNWGGPDSGRGQRIRAQNQALIAFITGLAAQGAFR